MNTQELDAGRQTVSPTQPEAEAVPSWERLLPAEPEPTPEQEVEAALTYLETDQTGSAHLVPAITSRVMAGTGDERMTQIVRDHLSSCDWCPKMLRDTLQVSGSPADHPAYDLLRVAENWVSQTRTKLDSLRDIPEGWDGDGAEAPNETALSGAARVLTILQRMDFGPDRVAPSAEGGVTFSFFVGSLYGDIEMFNTGAMLAATSDGTGQPEIWEVADDETAIIDALQKISAALNGSETPSIQATPKPELTEKQKGLIALLDTWAEEDQTDDPEELDRRDRELKEFKNNMNKWRTEEGRGPVYS